MEIKIARSSFVYMITFYLIKLNCKCEMKSFNSCSKFRRYNEPDKTFFYSIFNILYYWFYFFLIKLTNQTFQTKQVFCLVQVEHNPIVYNVYNLSVSIMLQLFFECYIGIVSIVQLACLLKFEFRIRNCLNILF